MALEVTRRLSLRNVYAFQFNVAAAPGRLLLLVQMLIGSGFVVRSLKTRATEGLAAGELDMGAIRGEVVGPKDAEQDLGLVEEDLQSIDRRLHGVGLAEQRYYLDLSLSGVGQDAFLAVLLALTGPGVNIVHADFGDPGSFRGCTNPAAGWTFSCGIAFNAASAGVEAWLAIVELQGRSVRVLGHSGDSGRPVLVNQETSNDDGSSLLDLPLPASREDARLPEIELAPEDDVQPEPTPHAGGVAGSAPVQGDNGVGPALARNDDLLAGGLITPAVHARRRQEILARSGPYRPGWFMP